jgi:hypothetical protein
MDLTVIQSKRNFRLNMNLLPWKHINVPLKIFKLCNLKYTLKNNVAEGTTKCSLLRYSHCCVSAHEQIFSLKYIWQCRENLYTKLCRVNGQLLWPFCLHWLSHQGYKFCSNLRYWNVASNVRFHPQIVVSIATIYVAFSTTLL